MSLTALLPTLKAIAEGHSNTLPSDMAADLILRIAPSLIDDDPLITVDEVCLKLKMDRTTLWRLRRAGQFIEPVKIGKKRLLFRRADFTKWLAQRTV